MNNNQKEGTDISFKSIQERCVQMSDNFEETPNKIVLKCKNVKLDEENRHKLDKNGHQGGYN